MKTKLTLTILAVMFSIFQLQADELNFRMQEESYINDIPFNTSLVLNEMHSCFALNMEFELLEETYINDIPFDTNEVIMEYGIDINGLSLKMAEEEYINDIPFDTKKIFESLLN
jgi:hypothetical protein